MAQTLLFNALREAIDEEMGHDPAVMVLGEDVGHYGGSYKVTKDLYKKYGDYEFSILQLQKIALPEWLWGQQ
jgi:pyruvate dehydrogenase E1 component beta subunit